jgi:hypothetical protein
MFILANVILAVGMPCGCTGAIPRKEGGIQVLAGLAPSSLAVGSLLRPPWPFASQKNSAKSENSEYTDRVKYPQLLFIHLLFPLFKLIFTYSKFLCSVSS